MSLNGALGKYQTKWGNEEKKPGYSEMTKKNSKWQKQWKNIS